MPHNMTTNVLIVGVGGQGVITLSDLMSRAAAMAGFDVKKSEVHGMSQRGGSVNSHVRFGPRVWSPLIEPGQADLILALEKLEALRYLPYLRPDTGRMLINDMRIDPIPVASGQMTYPDDPVGACRAAARHVIVIDAKSEADALGNSRLQSTLMAGAASAALGLGAEFWKAAMEARFPKKWLDINRKAFERGVTLGSQEKMNESEIN